MRIFLNISKTKKIANHRQIDDLLLVLPTRGRSLYLNDEFGEELLDEATEDEDEEADEEMLSRLTWTWTCLDRSPMSLWRTTLSSFAF